ncbi:phospholipase A2 [Umezawaea beigongshangensis]|uniref:phospholipase A2 n=1 Tax=Umezawaea beigongshangensis TaxID=2780383 RepID=UPI0027DE39BE|nr:phospholipase A2 [Umezawaea beigongshangensis]
MALAVFVCGVVASRPAGATDEQVLGGDVAAASRAVDALALPSADHDPRAEFPHDFAAVQNTTPEPVVAPDGTLRAVHVGGGCSGPAGDTEWDFGTACRAHDLGYDLLRYAESKGQPLGPDARRKLDARLSTDMHAQCEANPRGSGVRCHAVAQLYSAGLGFNSWRQRWGPPGHEPVLAWGFGIAVVVFLLVARLPGARRREPDPAPAQSAAFTPRPAVQDRFATFLRLGSLALVVLGQSLLTVLYWGGISANWLWLLTWVLQAVPVFFFAGGHANLLAWQAVRDDQGGYGRYLAGRISWLMRPMLAFVLAWLVLPLPLQLLDAPQVRVDAFSRMIAYPLWFLSLYLVGVALTPLAAWLHGRVRLVTPLALLAAMVVADTARAWLHWRTGGYLNLLLGALFLQQIGFFYADGSLLRVSRRALVALAALTPPALGVLIAFGGYPRTMMTTPGEALSNVSPPTICLLVLGLGQICLVVAQRDRVSAWLHGHRPWSVVAFTRSAPMTVYLGYLTVLAAVVGLLGVLDGPAPAALTVAEWLSRPRWITGLVVLLVPLLLFFHRFERHAHHFPGTRSRVEESHRGRLAAVLGVLFGALGLLGFVTTGFSGGSGTLVVLPVDTLQNLIHLLLGWYLVHSARAGTCHARLPWMLTAVACVPPLLSPESNAACLLLHGAVIVVALAAAVPRGATGMSSVTPS